MFSLFWVVIEAKKKVKLKIIPKTIIIKSKKQFYLIFYIGLLCLRICLEILNFIFELEKKKNPIYFLSLLNFCSYLMYLIHVHKILKGKRWYIFCSTILCCLKFKYDLGIFRRIHNKYDIPLMEERSLKPHHLSTYFSSFCIKGSKNLTKIIILTFSTSGKYKLFSQI